MSLLLRRFPLRLFRRRQSPVTDEISPQLPDYARALAPESFNEANPLRRTMAFIKLDRSDVTVLAVYGIAIGLFSLAVPVTVQALVNSVAFTGLRQPLLVLTILLAMALGVWATLRALQLRVVEMLQRRLFVRIASEIAQRLPHVQHGAFETRNGPELLNRFFDIFTAQKAFANLLTQGLDAALVAGVGLVVLAFYHPILLAFDVVLIATSVLVFWVLGHGGVKSGIAESKAKYAVAGWLEEMARHPVLFKLEASRNFAAARTSELALTYLQQRDRHFGVVFRQFVGALSTQVLASVALLALGGMLVMERQLTIGQLVAAELIVTAVVASIISLGNKVETFYDLLASVDKIGELLDLPLEPLRKDEAIVLRDSAPVLEARGVLVSGDDTIGPTFDFEVAKGERVHLYGLNERTSAALGDLLFGLTEAKQGTLILGGHNYNDIELTTLRKHVGIVRRAESLPGSIADNVRAANPKLTAQEVWSALREVALESEVAGLPEGIHTQLGPTAKPLSQGEALRLTIARVLVSKPSLLVLDHVFDALPASNQRELAESLRALSNVAVVSFSENESLYGWCDRSINLLSASQHNGGVS